MLMSISSLVHPSIHVRFDWFADVVGAFLCLVMLHTCPCASGARLGAGDPSAEGARASRRAKEEALRAGRGGRGLGGGRV